MAEYEFINPDFMEGNSPEEIQQRMMAALPVDIDDMPGGFPYDFTMPTAMEKAELIHFFIPRLLMLMFPQYAWEEWLDLHGQSVGLLRRNAAYAFGYVTVSGEDEVSVPMGTVFCTPATESSAAIEFVTSETKVIQDGTAQIPVTAFEAGSHYNVAAGTITLSLRPIRGVTGITNLEAITGGAEGEADDTFRDRIMDANFAKGTNFVGNISDYRRWAMEVSGVGSVTVIPTWDGPGTVKIVVIDTEGHPANERIIKDVFDHIMAPEDPFERKAPIGVELTVSAPTTGTIQYRASVILKEDARMDDVKSEFGQLVADYYNKAKEEEILRYSRIYSILSETPGVLDFTGLLVNGGTANINIAKDNYPVTGVIDFTVVV